MTDAPHDQRCREQARENIDIEDPAPRKLVYEEAAEQRSHNGRDAPDAGEQSLHFGALFEGEHLPDQNECQRHDSACANSL